MRNKLQFYVHSINFFIKCFSNLIILSFSYSKLIKLRYVRQICCTIKILWKIQEVVTTPLKKDFGTGKNVLDVIQLNLELQIKLFKELTSLRNVGGKYPLDHLVETNKKDHEKNIESWIQNIIIIILSSTLFYWVKKKWKWKMIRHFIYAL